MEIPVRDLRNVLLDHLLSKVSPLCSSRQLAREILLEVSNNLANQDIMHLLQDDKALKETINKSKAYRDAKEELGEEIFVRVSLIESEICAKITGMLLELDAFTLKQLLLNDSLLSKAVEKSKKKFLEFSETNKRKEEVGELLYLSVSKSYDPQVAPHLTGMLLELDSCTLDSLINDPAALKDKLESAHRAYLTFYRK